MKRSTQLFSAPLALMSALALTLALLAGAGAAEAQEVKVGVVDFERAFFSTEEGKAAREEFERKQREAQAELEPLGKQRRELMDELEDKRFVLSEDALFQKRSQLAELQNRLESRSQELEGQLKIDRGRLYAPLQQKLRQVITDVGKEQGFTMILESNNNPILLYAQEKLDITDLVVSRFDKD